MDDLIESSSKTSRPALLWSPCETAQTETVLSFQKHLVK